MVWVISPVLKIITLKLIVHWANLVHMSVIGKYSSNVTCTVDQYSKIHCVHIEYQSSSSFHAWLQSLQEEPSSTSSQLAELMMAARVSLTSELPRDLPADALLKHGTFLINLEGEDSCKC